MPPGFHDAGRGGLRIFLPRLVLLKDRHNYMLCGGGGRSKMGGTEEMLLGLGGDYFLYGTTTGIILASRLEMGIQQSSNSWSHCLASKPKCRRSVLR